MSDRRDGEVVTCVSCGTENEADSVFCSACNHFLQWEEPVRETRSRRARRSSDLAAALGAAPDPAEPEPVPAEPEPIPAEPEPVPAAPIPADPEPVPAEPTVSLPAPSAARPAAEPIPQPSPIF